MVLVSSGVFALGAERLGFGAGHAVMQDAMAAGQARAQERMPARLEALQKKLMAEAEAMKAEQGGATKK